ncbi:unnamed protein product [Pleuronectes platessa]|uniref:Uncharacterized protein n=1 Tax=Pleuronectes platessa TaxID=8262 RepID=A0A9N7UKI4_PLEPL|nr:unnamed protein product [Pleuronectes platessa]
MLLPPQPERFNQMAPAACCRAAYSGVIFLSSDDAPTAKPFGLRPTAQSAACVDHLTQTCGVTLKWHRPDGRDDFSVYCHNGKTECTGARCLTKANHAPGRRN